MNDIDNNNNNTVIACHRPLSFQVKMTNKLIIYFNIFEQYKLDAFNMHGSNFEESFES